MQQIESKMKEIITPHNLKAQQEPSTACTSNPVPQVIHVLCRNTTNTAAYLKHMLV